MMAHYPTSAGLRQIVESRFHWMPVVSIDASTRVALLRGMLGDSFDISYTAIVGGKPTRYQTCVMIERGAP